MEVSTNMTNTYLIMILSPLLVTATYQPIKNCLSFQGYLDELVHFVF